MRDRLFAHYDARIRGTLKTLAENQSRTYFEVWEKELVSRAKNDTNVETVLGEPKKSSGLVQFMKTGRKIL